MHVPAVGVALDSGGGETALYKSMDGGATWKKLTNGIPQMLDRIGVAVARSEPDIVYMISETPNYDGELWRSRRRAARAGAWSTRIRSINFRPFYYADIRVDPNDPNRVYSLGGSLCDVGRRRPQLPHDRPRRARRSPGAVDRSAPTRSGS